MQMIGLRRSLRFVESVGYQIGRHVSDSRRGASGAGGEVGSFALDFEQLVIRSRVMGVYFC